MVFFIVSSSFHVSALWFDLGCSVSEDLLAVILPFVRSFSGRMSCLINDVLDCFIWCGIGNSAEVSPFNQFFLVSCGLLWSSRRNDDPTHSSLLFPISNKASLQSADSVKNQEVLSRKKIYLSLGGLTPTSMYVWEMAEPIVRRCSCRDALLSAGI